MSTVAPAGYDLEQAITRIIDRYEGKATALIMILQDIQSHCRYLPREALDLVAERMELPAAQIYGVATFYRAFSLKPKGRHHLCVCTGTACHVRQANVILESLQRKLGVPPGETTPDGEFSYETVNCLGACALAPLLTAGEEFHGDMTVARLDRLLQRLRTAEDAAREEVNP